MNITRIPSAFVLAFVLAVASPALAEGDLAEIGSGERAGKQGEAMLDSADAVARSLHDQLRRHGKDTGTILVASLTDLEDMDASSPFGRLAMQQIASRLGSRGHEVVEARLRRDYVIAPEKGEQMLTRDVTALRASDHPAWAALVGNYSRAGETVFVSVRVVRLVDGVQLAAEEYRLPLRGEVKQLFVASSGRANQWAHYAMRDPAFVMGGAQPQASAASGPQVASPADPALMPQLKAFPPFGAEGRKVEPARGAVKKSKAAKSRPATAKAKSVSKQKPKAVSKPSAKEGGAPAPSPLDTPGPNGLKDA